MSLFHCAIDHFQKISDPDGVARVRVVRGLAFFHQGSIDEALRDEHLALESLCVDSPRIYHAAAVVNIAGMLALGRPEHFALAEQFLSSFRQRLRGVGDFTIVRLKMRWVEGLIYARLGQINRAIRKLENVRQALTKLRQDFDLVAVSADLAILNHEKSNCDWISLLANTCLRMIGASNPATSALRSLSDAVAENTAAIPTAAIALRFAVTSSVPSLLEPALAPGPLIACSDA